MFVTNIATIARELLNTCQPIYFELCQGHSDANFGTQRPALFQAMAFHMDYALVPEELHAKKNEKVPCKENGKPHWPLVTSNHQKPLGNETFCLMLGHSDEGATESQKPILLIDQKQPTKQ